jgi:hypothetical protein
MSEAGQIISSAGREMTTVVEAVWVKDKLQGIDGTSGT